MPSAEPNAPDSLGATFELSQPRRGDLDRLCVRKWPAGRCTSHCNNLPVLRPLLRGARSSHRLQMPACCDSAPHSRRKRGASATAHVLGRGRSLTYVPRACEALLELAHLLGVRVLVSTMLHQLHAPNAALHSARTYAPAADARTSPADRRAWAGAACTCAIYTAHHKRQEVSDQPSGRRARREDRHTVLHVPQTVPRSHAST